MTNKNDGGAAFPHASIKMDEHGAAFGNVVPGMSLRDWFAGQALAGLLRHDDGCHIQSYAVDAYRIADVMLAERARKAAEQEPAS